MNALADKLAAEPTKAYAGAKQLIMPSLESTEVQLVSDPRRTARPAIAPGGRDGIDAFLG